MGFRFRRSIRLFPGVRLNLSRSGISTSVGVRGAHVTIGKNGERTTVGIPGTGLSYTAIDSDHPRAVQAQAPDAVTKPRGRFRWWMIALGLLGALIVFNAVMPPLTGWIALTFFAR